MLIGLYLRDFALAERVELDLRGGFTVITGETGAGKSVLIQALTFALGSSADAEMIRLGADSAEVEAAFELAAGDAFGPIARMLSDADIPFDGELIIRRTLSRPRDGSQRMGGRLRINDRAATVGLLRDLALLLADIHGQREHLSLLRPQEQLDLLDRYRRGRTSARRRVGNGATPPQPRSTDQRTNRERARTSPPYRVAAP